MKTGGVPSKARLSRWRAQADEVVELSKPLVNLSDEELLTKGREIRWRAKAGIPLRTLLPETYALVRESARRVLGFQHYPVQVMGAICLFDGGISEMQTGEGKTLTATMPVFIRGLEGLGSHVVTVNDYLAKRDAEEMGPIYEKLGLTVGCIQDDQEDDERRQNYAKDITYGTAKEFGFDFLRDRLKKGSEFGGPPRTGLFGEGGGGVETVQRGHHFALVDEADSVLVDEARTPLIIALNQPNDPATVSLYRWSNRVTH